MPLLQNKREKILASLVGGLVLVLGGSIGGRALLDFRNDLEQQLARAETDELDAQGWIGEEEYWRNRGKWLKEFQPKIVETRRDTLELLQKVEESARSHGLEVTNRMIKDGVNTEEFSATPIRVDVAGSFAGLVAWMHELQQPKSFLRINELTIKSGSKPDIIDCSVDLMRCYQPVAIPKGA